MIILRICWAIDGLAFLIAFYFFLDGLATATTPSAGFFGAWLLLLGFIASELVGSYWLLHHGHRTGALVVAAVPAVLATLLGLWFLILIVGGSNGRWN